jgi:microcystin-dependent protein
MAEPFLSEIRIVSFSFPPKGWALCNGQLMQINQNQALFALLGTTYGGDGRTTFALPNLQGRVPFHVGNGFTLGQTGGEAGHTLSLPELPAHRHRAFGTSATADQASPAGNLWAQGAASAYGPTADVPMSPMALSNAGGSQPHENMAPYLVLNFVIALQGVFPPRS